MKPNKLAIIFFSFHSLLVLIISFCEFFLTRNEENRGALFMIPGLLDKPALFLFSPFLNMILGHGDFFITMPLVLFVIGGLQWYLVGWFLSSTIFGKKKA